MIVVVDLFRVRRARQCIGIGCEEFRSVFEGVTWARILVHDVDLLQGEPFGLYRWLSLTCRSRGLSSGTNLRYEEVRENYAAETFALKEFY